MLRSIGEIDKALLYLRRSIETRKDTTDFTTIVDTTDVLSEIIVQVAIIDANGIMRASNAGPQPAPTIDLSDREHYRFISPALKTSSSSASPSSAASAANGRCRSRGGFERRQSFGGVVVASLDPDHFTKFYDKIDFGSPASISLIGSDGDRALERRQCRRFRARTGSPREPSCLQKCARREHHVRGLRSAERRAPSGHAAQGRRSSAVGERQHRHETRSTRARGRPSAQCASPARHSP